MARFPRHILTVPRSSRTGNQRAPSVGIPERFTQKLCGLSPSVRRQGPPTFQSDIPLRFGCLRVSGAVAPSATVLVGYRLSRRVRLSDSTTSQVISSILCSSILPVEGSGATARANRIIPQRFVDQTRNAAERPVQRRWRARLNFNSSGVSWKPNTISVLPPSLGFLSGMFSATSSW